jgi:S-DNA-T family DNA segregation ATPase FtsK/SpoIIIE
MLRTAFAGRGNEMLGLGLVLGGLLAGLSIYLDKAGIVGRIIDSASGWTVGITKIALPVVMVVTGLAMFRERSEFGEITKRLPVGTVLGLSSVTGLLHLTRGQPGLGDGIDELGTAGGVLGLGVGGGLSAVVATWGAVLILIGLGLVGAAVVTRVTARQAARMAARGAGAAARQGARGLVAGLRASARGLGNWVRGLLTAPGTDDQPVAGPGTVEPRPESQTATPPESEPTPQAATGTAPTPSRPKRRRNRPGEPVGGEQMIIQLGELVAGSPWALPSPEILARSDTHDVDAKAAEARGVILQEALAAHGVETRLVDMTIGPTVTRYALQVGEGVKVSRVTSLSKDIAYSLAAADVRILAPIPGRQAIGIEVPNEEREVVALGDILASVEARKARHPLEVAVGRDISGRAVMLDLATMPHLLIAGATGAGKSSCINAMIASILMRTTPEVLRLILIDPKRVEMGRYDGVPHLLTAPVTDPKKAANALHWAVREMERRYDVLSVCGYRDISGYNAAYDRGDLVPPPGLDEEGELLTYDRLPFILVVVDELSDLMMVAARDVEDSICRLAQMARAVGIHLVVATQRPSVDIITGLIKANIPARLAFAVASLADSRVILDQQGAERLVGMGDMLLLGPSSSAPQRIQGAWVDEHEVRQVVAAWKAQVDGLENADESAEEATGDEVVAGRAGGAGPVVDITSDRVRPAAVTSDEDDELLEQARHLVVTSQLGSTSMLQRKLRVGFARAGRLMDLLEEAGVVGPSTGSKAREVLISSEDLQKLRQQGD